MKITFIGHATMLIQTQDLSLLCDPVFKDPFCEGINAIFPSRQVEINLMPAYDAIFISHQHLDHFDVRTLKLLKHDVDIFIPRDPLLNKLLKIIGFTKIFELDEMDVIKIGGTLMVSTPSLNKVPELGIAINEGGNTFWNQVDTVSTAQSIAQVKDKVGEIDYLVAPWQPFLETSWHMSGDARFPYKLYESLLNEINMVNAHFVTPGANGLRFVNRSAALNHVAFPITPERLRLDLQSASPTQIEVILASPGDVATLTNHNVTLQSKGADFISIPEILGKQIIAFAPSTIGGPYDNVLEREVLSFQNPLYSKLLLSMVESMSPSHNKELKNWGVVYQIVIEDAGETYACWIDFTKDSLLIENGWSPLNNYMVFVSGSLIKLLSTEAVSLAYLVTSGEYRIIDKVYLFKEGTIHRPTGSECVKDPFYAFFSQNGDSLLEKSLLTELSNLECL